MPQIKHNKQIGALDYRAGQRTSIDLDRGAVALGLSIRVQYTITNGGSDAVGPLYQALARIIRRLEVTVNGQDTVVSVTGETLAAMQFIRDQVVAQGMDATVVLTASAATAYDITLNLPFVLAPRLAQRADDCALDLRGARSAQLAVTWAGAASDIYATPNGATIGSVTCTVEAEYLLDAPADRAYLVRSLDLVSQVVAAANNNLGIDIDNGSGVLIRSLHVEQLIDNVAANTILAGQLALQSNDTRFAFGHTAHLRARNRRDYGVAMPTGVLVMDATMFGSMVTAINTAGLPSTLRLVADASAPAGTTRLINITRETVRPLKLALAA